MEGEVFPESVRVRALADVLSAIHGLAQGEQVDDEADGGTIRLIGVKRGSAIFRCVAEQPNEIFDGLRRTRALLNDPARYDELSGMLGPLRCLSEVAGSVGSPVVIRGTNGSREEYIRIEPTTYKQVSYAVLMSGDKMIRGTVQRVGGATEPKCALRIPDRAKLLFCTVADDSVAHDLARFLYGEVVVTGLARWIRRTWEIVEYDIREVQCPRGGALSEAFEALRKAGGSAWDNVTDPEEFLREVSG